MDYYATSLLNTIRKIFRTPHPKSAAYGQLQRQLYTIMTQLNENIIDRQKAADDLYNLVIKLERLPPRQGREEERISVLLQLLNPIQFAPNSILDVGAGTSDITTALKTHYNLSSSSVFAIDQKLPQVINVTPLTYDTDGKIPLPTNSIDLIIMFVVLHHIPPEYRSGVISEIYRVLSPNGVFIIREHDNDGTPEFYIFLDMIHLFWYIASNETPDPLYLMSRNEIHDIMNQHGLEPKSYITYGDNNPQRLYHELYTKKQIATPILTNRFADTIAQQTLQTYVDKLRLSPSRDYDAFLSLVPTKLQQGLIDKYGVIIQTNPASIWPDINKDVTLAIVLGAVKYSNIVNNQYIITADAIHKSFSDLI